MTTHELGNRRLREARLQAGFTQLALAVRAGTDELTISKLECGRLRTPKPEIRQRIAEALNREPWELGI